MFQSQNQFNYFNVLSFSDFYKKIHERFVSYISRNEKMHEKALLPYSSGWVSPTHTELAEFKKLVGYSTIELAEMVGMNPKNLRNFFKEKSYINGKRIQYTVWRYWLESFGLAEVNHLKTKRPFLRSSIFSAKSSVFEKPKISELRVLVSRSGSSVSKTSRSLDFSESMLSHYLYSNNVDANLVFPIEHKNWLNFLLHIGISSLTEYSETPKLPNVTLLPLDSGFEPPNPKVLRQFISWTGYTPNELAQEFGVESSKISFYCSNRSARTAEVSLDPKIYSAIDWRCPTYSELRTFINILSIDKYEAAKILKMGKQEIDEILSTRDNDYSKLEPLDLYQSDWFNLLDAQKVIDGAELKSLVDRENRAHHINYSLWRVMLQSFGVLAPLKYEVKEVVVRVPRPS